jgi:[ribosomal protein S5]-alanine N-acetyltransferase
MNTTIETPRLRIIVCNEIVLRHAIKGNRELREYLNVKIPGNWTVFGMEALQYSLEKLGSGENEAGWWTYFPIHREDAALIGSGGYKGKPSDDGFVEIGYEIAGDYRNRGLATEFAQALIRNAFHHDQVHSIIAQTLGEVNASTRVLVRCGFTRTEEINDPDDGIIWRWQLKRQAYNLWE